MPLETIELPPRSVDGVALCEESAIRAFLEEIVVAGHTPYALAGGINLAAGEEAVLCVTLLMDGPESNPGPDSRDMLFRADDLPTLRLMVDELERRTRETSVLSDFDKRIGQQRIDQARDVIDCCEQMLKRVQQ